MRRLALLATFVVAGPAIAEPVAVTNDALRQLAAGKTVHLESPYGTLPVTFKEDGTLSAKATGGLAVYLGSLSDRGRWTVQGDRICQKFFKWFAGETHCMRIRQDGRKITWRRDDGLTGTATIAANDAPKMDRPVGLGVPPDAVASAKADAGGKANAGQGTAPPAPVAAVAQPVLKEPVPAPEPPTLRPREAEPKVAAKPPAQERTEVVPPRPVLASLHGLPRGLFSGRWGADPATEMAAPSLERPVPQPLPAITARDAVADALWQRTSHLWCEDTAGHNDTAGQMRPYIFDILIGEAAGFATRARGTGCLMPTATLTDIARIAAGGR